MSNYLPKWVCWIFGHKFKSCPAMKNIFQCQYCGKYYKKIFLSSKDKKFALKSKIKIKFKHIKDIRK